MFFVNRLLFLIPHILYAGMLILVSMGVGYTIIKLFKTHQRAPIIVLTSILVGYTVFSYYYFFVGMLSLCREPFIVTIPLIFWLLALFPNRDVVRKCLENIQKHKKFVLLLFFFIGLVSLYKVFPDKGFDSNWYHLSQPTYYLKEGRIFHLGGYIFPSGYPQFAEMLFIPLLYLGDSTTTSAFSLLNFFLLGFAVYILAKKFDLDRNWSLLTVILVLTTDKIFYYAGLAYVDNLQALSLTIAVYWLMDFIQLHSKKSLFLASLVLVPMCAIKYTGGLLCIPIVFLLIRQRSYKYPLMLASMPVLGLIPWLVRNWLEVGNPFDPVGSIKMFHYGSTAINYLDYFANINWLETFRLLYLSSKEIIIPTLILVVLITSLLMKKWIILLSTAVMLVIWRALPPGNDYRYLIPYLPIFSILGLKSLAVIKSRLLQRSFQLLIVLLLLIQYFNTTKVLAPLTKYAFGLQTAQEYKNYYFVLEPFMFYDPSGKVKKEVRDSKMLIKGADLIYPTVAEFNVKDYSFADLVRNKIYTFKTLRDEMERNKYSYFLTNRGDLAQHFTIWFKETDTDKVSVYFDTVFAEKNQYGKEWFLYRIK